MSGAIQGVANGHEHNPFVNKYPIVCSYAPILESIIIIIIIANYSRDVFCPKFATLTVSIVTFQKSVLKFVPNDVPKSIPIDDACVNPKPKPDPNVKF